MFAGMTRAAHAPLRPQVVHQLFLQYSSRLNEQSAINSLVRHVHTLVVGITGLQPSGNLFGRPVQHQFTRNHVTQPAVAGQKTTLRAQRRHPCPAICIVGTISRTTTMAGDLPAHRRGGTVSEPGGLPKPRNKSGFSVSWRCPAFERIPPFAENGTS